jgi:hypothetical protein
MGAAVIGLECVFTVRDFRRRLQAPPRHDPRLVGLFASLGEMNDWIRVYRRRRSQARKKKFRRDPRLSFPEF